MKKRYSKPRKKEVPSRRKLAAEVGDLVCQVVQRQHLLELYEKDLQQERLAKGRVEGLAIEARRECRRLQKEVDELVGDGWELSSQVRVRAYADECFQSLTFHGGRVHVGVQMDWRPFQRYSRGEKADAAWLRAVKRKLLAKAEEELDKQLCLRG